MIDLQDDTRKVTPFHDAQSAFGGFDSADTASLAMAAGDLALVVSAQGIIRDAAGGADGFANLHDWIGKSWEELVTLESRPKIGEMLDDAEMARPRWRQVNHLGHDGDVPIRFLTVRPESSRSFIAIGRDIRPSAALQQRLLQAQQSLERDYLRLRQAESRYRLLFEKTAEPMLIVDAADRRIREINPAAARLLAAPPGIAGQQLAPQIAGPDREALIGFLGAVAAGASLSPLAVMLASGALARITASAFRQGGSNYFLIRLAGADDRSEVDGPPVADIIERMPDGFVVTDRALGILTANAAFAEMVQAGSADRLRGAALGDFVGRPGIDLELIYAQLAEQDVVRNIATILRGLDGGQEEIELAAVRVASGGDHYGFTIRVVGRRLRDLPPAGRDLPRSVEQLTELVGRVPLKDIVRESTDLIERLCIEAALAYTSNNRASAAEILGLSRQSLYAKLNRHGLGARGGDEE